MIKITRILHAGYIFENQGTKVAFDPVFENPFSVNCYAYPNVKFDVAKIRELKFSAVFISHIHDDHCSLESLIYLDRSTPIYIFCAVEEIFLYLKTLGFTQVTGLTLDKAVQINSLTIVPRRALDADVDSLFHISAVDLNILNVVDSWIDPQTLHKLTLSKPWDLILWPFQTMREVEVLAPTRFLPADGILPSEWINQLISLQPKFLVPSSCQFIQEEWSWHRQAFFPISYQSFQKQVQSILPETVIWRLNPGNSMSLTQNTLCAEESVPWIIPVGDQDLDYQYNPSLKAPTTAEVAKNFPSLKKDQQAAVIKFCQEDLPKKLSTRELPPESYFQKSRVWRLSLFDHDGREQTFTYRLSNSVVLRLEGYQGNLDWLSEIPVFKLHSALTTGEGLTSLYLRINDALFSKETEEALVQADALEDPLIWCLYQGEVASYQRHQLAKILHSRGLVSATV